MRIGLFLNNLDEEYQISVYRGLKAEAELAGLDIICMQGGLSPLRTSLTVDGILVLSSVIFSRNNTKHTEWNSETFGSTPCVSIGKRIPNVHSIIIHSKKSMEMIMNHLISFHGYRKFLYIGGPEGHQDNIVREHVFRETIKKYHADIPEIEGTVTNGGFRESTSMQIMKDYIRTHRNEPLDAVVAANDNMAIGALKTLHSTPDERWQTCAVTGFDDIPQARLEVPALTTAKQPLDELGRLAVRTIWDLIEKKKIEEVLQVETHVVVRNSCGCCSVENFSISVPDKQLKRVQYQSMMFEQYLRTVSAFGQKMTTADSMNEMTDLLREFLNDNEIKTFFLFLYPQGTETGDVVHLVYRRFRNEEGVFSGSAQKTMLKEFFRTNFRSDERVPAFPCVYSLRSGTEEIGFIVYESEDFAHPHICSGAVFIANTVKRLMHLEDEKERSRMLEREIQLRTKDLLKMNRELKKESKQRLAVEKEVLHISEMERLRFSLDLHDDICQRLAGISMFSKSLEKGADLRELSEMIDETLLRTRQYAHDSFPVELDSLGLNEAIGSLCHSIQKQTGCICEYSWELPESVRITNAQEINLYRIIQEAMNNIIKHSGATHSDISVTHKNSELVVQICDNGKGIPKNTIKETGWQKKELPHAGIGLKSMEYRAHQINAKYSLKSSKEGGTIIEIRLPVIHSPTL